VGHAPSFSREPRIQKNAQHSLHNASENSKRLLIVGANGAYIVALYHASSVGTLVIWLGASTVWWTAGAVSTRFLAEMVEHSISDTDISVIFEPQDADPIVEYASLLCFGRLPVYFAGCFKFTNYHIFLSLVLVLIYDIFRTLRTYHIG